MYVQKHFKTFDDLSPTRMKILSKNCNNQLKYDSFANNLRNSLLFLCLKFDFFTTVHCAWQVQDSAFENDYITTAKKKLFTCVRWLSYILGFNIQSIRTMRQQLRSRFLLYTRKRWLARSWNSRH